VEDSRALTQLNALPQLDAERELQSCCASPAWAHRVAAARPFADVGGLLSTSEATLAALDWSEIEAALSAHPRIGQRAIGATREASWSAQEQAGTAAAPVETATALREVNEAYEQRFGHVFLIYASGRSAEEMLAAARERLHHDDETERRVVRGELSKITRLRLRKLLDA
jgi:2-oxo-4-hydroxy-4-carboxy-5-ureidoimidazoline decarboxylase